MTPFKRLVLLLLIPAIYLFRYNIITLLQRWFYSDYQIDRSTNNTWATFAVYFLIWAAKLYLLAIAGRAAPHVAQCGPGRQVEAIFIIGFIIQLFVPFEPNIFRIGLYYQSSVLLLVPQITSESRLSLRSRRLIRIAYIAVMFLMYYGFTYQAAEVNPYRFFWQG